MNVPYENKKDLLDNWLSPSDVEALGIKDLDIAKKKGETWQKVHQELDTLPRCAQHGTVSKMFLLIRMFVGVFLKMMLLFCSGILRRMTCHGVMVVMRNMSVL